MITYKTTVNIVIEDVEMMQISSTHPSDVAKERKITVYTKQGDTFELTLLSDKPIKVDDNWIIPEVYNGKPVADEKVAP